MHALSLKVHGSLIVEPRLGSEEGVLAVVAHGAEVMVLGLGKVVMVGSCGDVHWEEHAVSVGVHSEELIIVVSLLLLGLGRCLCWCGWGSMLGIMFLLLGSLLCIVLFLLFSFLGVVSFLLLSLLGVMTGRSWRCRRSRRCRSSWFSRCSWC